MSQQEIISDNSASDYIKSKVDSEESFADSMPKKDLSSKPSAPKKRLSTAQEKNYITKPLDLQDEVFESSPTSSTPSSNNNSPIPSTLSSSSLTLSSTSSSPSSSSDLTNRASGNMIKEELVDNSSNNEELREQLNNLLIESATLQCIDCQEVGADWCSLSFGTYLCLSCAGYHRSLGTHITSVRSLKLDIWTANHLSMIKIGKLQPKDMNTMFKDYLNTLVHFKDKINSNKYEKYNLPEVLYYTEILRSKIESRPPALYNHSIWSKLITKKTNGVSITPVWINDKLNSKCMVCSMSFTLFNRRHHCRRCGKLVCNSCAPQNNTRPIIEWGFTKPVRHCKLCYRSPIVQWNDKDEEKPK